MIIGLCGRKLSGKSEFAKICQKKGFHVIHFADELKNLISMLLGWSREQLDIYKESKLKFQLTNQQLKQVSDITRIDYEIVVEIVGEKIFTSPREMLQFFGTDLIRKNNPDWHIDEMKKKIIKGESYCIDDCRFPNEKQFIENYLSGKCYFIIRPGNFNISNHASEVSLKWNDCENIIINNFSIDALKERWSNFVDYLKKSKKEENATILLEKFGLINNDKNKLYNKEAFLYPNPLNSYCAGLLALNGGIKNDSVYIESKNFLLIKRFSSLCNSEISAEHVLDSNYTLSISSEYIIENLKHWNTTPQPKSETKVPDIIKNNESAIKHWVCGLIDGSRKETLSLDGLNVLIQSESEQIVDFVNNFIETKGKKIKQKNNFLLVFDNYKTERLLNWLGHSVACES
jgi:hypothetical protein